MTGPDRPASSNLDQPDASAVRHLRRDVVAMAPYTPGEQLGKAIKLNTNECPWPPSPAVLAVLGAIGADQLRLYPDPVSRELRRAAAAAYGVSPEQVLAGNGSDDCLTIIYRSFLAPGDRVACPWPTYGLYETLAAIQGVELVHVDYKLAERAWTLPSALARQNAKVVIIANPNNPSATIVPIAELRRLADQVDGVLVVDEAYIDFAEADGAKASMIPHLDQHPNLIVLRTFSKSYSLAGARLGLLFAAAPLVANLAKVKDSYNVNVISQALGTAALNDRDRHLDQVRTTVRERQRLERALAAFGWSWPESAGNFLLCEVGPRAGEIYRALKERGVLVRWWDKPLLSSKLRITVGRPEDDDRLVALIRELW
ncbi:MAG: histidinol-phosphate transaminase [Planctomycetes bacterium]|nr:histidinol-phosphate transaminase [Planctomycetota bacterium]